MFEFEWASVLLKGICFASQQVDGYLLGSKKSTTQKNKKKNSALRLLVSLLIYLNWSYDTKPFNSITIELILIAFKS